MLLLPDGFNYLLLLSDLWGCVLPFVPVYLLFVAYRFYKRTISHV